VITSEAWRGRRYAVLGLARSGASSVRALVASGAEVVAWDERAEARTQFLPGTGRWPEGPEGSGRASPDIPASRLASNGPSVSPAGLPPPRSGEDLLRLADPLTLDLTGFAGVVVSPGVPLNRHPIAGHAAKYGVPVIGDIELFAQARAELPPHKVVGITGTNGKSTTTALVHHILKTAGVPTTMGGNIGLPILGQEPLPAGGVYVLELSSFQIDLTFTLDCDVAVLLNVTPDHLDRYASFEAYIASKARVFEMQTSDHYALARAGDWWGNDHLVGSHSNAGFFDPYDDVFYLRSGVPGAIGIYEQGEWPTLQGPHNLDNVSTAMSIAYDLGLDAHQIRAGLQTYPGLPHRMERIRDLNGVLFVNDSKATNPTSTAPALAAYPALHWILGGQAKTDELDACAPHFGHVRAAYTIGAAGGMFADLLRPHMAVEESGTLELAVAHAAAAAQPGETVLLSPACASFDQFRDYEDRGDAFRRLVEAL
jgi:UDP-N-acetylmuramoylalanine--D-glutamate ligase